MSKIRANYAAYEQVRSYLHDIEDNEERAHARAFILGYVSVDVPAAVLLQAIEAHRESRV